MLGRIESCDRRGKFFEDPDDALAPVGGAHDDEEIIAADVTDEIEPRREDALQQARECRIT